MAGTEQVLVPDIGDFDDVPVIEVLVSVGDEVAAEDPLVVLESDKATMEVPSPSAGKVASIEVSVGDKVKEGTPIVNAPEVAILGVVRSKMAPVWNGSEFVPRLMVPLSLSYDHRVIDGALAARFVAHLVQQLSDLRRVLL